MRTEPNPDGKNRDIAISLCMIVKNEEKTLERCLNSVSGIANEVVIGDTGSTDNTVQVAKKYGARVINIDWSDNFSRARNQVLEHASGEWILHLDADEELAPDTDHKFTALINPSPRSATPASAYYLSIIDTATAEKFGAIRLFKNDKNFRYKGMIHEAIDFGDLADQPGFIAEADINILHHGYEMNVVEEKAKQERNSKLVSAALRAEPEDPKINYYYGHLLDTEGRYEEAIKYYERAVTYDKNNIFPASVRSWVMLLEQSGRIEEGIKAAIEGIRHHPEFTDLFYLMGLLLMRAGRLPQALKYFEEAMTLGPPPSSYPSYRNISEVLAAREAATCYRLLGEDEKALHLYSDVLRRDRSDIFALKGCAAILSKNFDRSRVIGMLKEMTDLDEEMLGKITMDYYQP